jgi:hypothetical protein
MLCGDACAMNSQKTALERAFELAESGTCDSIEDIRKQLKSEGFSLAQLMGASLMKQLREVIRTSRAVGPGE